MLYNIVEIGVDLPSKVELEVLVVLALPHPSFDNVSLNIFKFTKCKVMNDSKLPLCSGERYTQLLIEIMNQSIIQQAHAQR